MDKDEAQPKALQIYKNIRSDVLETAEQLKNIKNTAFKVMGIQDKGGECEMPTCSQEENSYDNSASISNSTMLSEMMKRKVNMSSDNWDNTGHSVMEGQMNAWMNSQQKQQPGFGLPSQPTKQTITSWQQTKPPSYSEQSFNSQMPPSRPFPQPQWHGVTPSSESQIPVRPQSPLPPQHQQLSGGARPLREPFALQTSGHVPDTRARAPNQLSMMRFSSGPGSPPILPRGFQLQMASIPLPPTSSTPLWHPPSQPIPLSEASIRSLRPPMLPSPLGFSSSTQAMGQRFAGTRPFTPQGMGANPQVVKPMPMMGRVLPSSQGQMLFPPPGQMQVMARGLSSFPGQMQMARGLSSSVGQMPGSFTPPGMPANTVFSQMAPSPQPFQAQEVMPPGIPTPRPIPMPMSPPPPLGARPQFQGAMPQASSPSHENYSRPQFGRGVAQPFPQMALNQQNFGRQSPPFQGRTQSS